MRRINMTQEATDLSATHEKTAESVPIGEAVDLEDTAEPLEDPCSCGRGKIAFNCYRCQKALCVECVYREENGTLTYCRSCANSLVGVCDVCDALYAKPCHECGKMVCEVHHKRVIERWGWGGRAGQGGVLEWFPILRTYCQDHGQNRTDKAKPEQRFTGLDGSSPEW
jgi:hypothetical protein